MTNVLDKARLAIKYSVNSQGAIGFLGKMKLSGAIPYSIVILKSLTGHSEFSCWVSPGRIFTNSRLYFKTFKFHNFLYKPIENLTRN